MHERALLIVNPVAGGQRAHRLAPRLADRLRTIAPGAQLIEAEDLAATEALAEEAAASGKRAVAVGGDGTIQAVVNGLLRAGGDRRPELGIVPGGSGNDLARSLGLPRQPEAALQVALAEPTRLLDIGQARTADRERYFVSAAGIGFDAQVAASMNGSRSFWQRGSVGYLLTALLELRSFDNRAVRLADEENDSEQRRVLLAAVANGAYYGGGFKICPSAETSDGLLDVCLVGDVSRFEALKQMPGLYRGAHVGHPAVEFRRIRELRIEGDDDTRIHLDGEPFGQVPVTFTVHPGAIRVAGGTGGGSTAGGSNRLG